MSFLLKVSSFSFSFFLFNFFPPAKKVYSSLGICWDPKGMLVILAVLGPGLPRGRRMAKTTFWHCGFQSADAE